MNFFQNPQLLEIGAKLAEGAMAGTKLEKQVEEKKTDVFDKIAPVVKAISPKWGDAIILVLKNLDLTKLLPLAESEEKLKEKVKEEEIKLEANAANNNNNTTSSTTTNGAQQSDRIRQLEDELKRKDEENQERIREFELEAELRKREEEHKERVRELTEKKRQMTLLQEQQARHEQELRELEQS